MALSRRNFEFYYLKNICEDCHRAICEAEWAKREAHWMSSEWYGYEPFSELERLTIYQEYREQAVETLHWRPWEEVHGMFDRMYREVEDEASRAVLAYI